jgi:L-glyceraldehyde 3-phosphate reductase
MGALDFAVRSGRALYAGISMYDAGQTRQAASIMRSLGTPLLIHQPNYSMFDRWIEGGLLDALDETGMGCIVFSPLEQGLLTNRYLQGIPADSRVAKPHGFLEEQDLTQERLSKVRRLNEIAAGRGQSLAQMALAWVLRQPRVTSALVGASRVQQVEDNIATLEHLDFAQDELLAINRILM